MPADFSQVQLTSEQQDELIYNERLRLYFLAKDEQKRQEKLLLRQSAKKPFTASELATFVLSNNESFEIDSASGTPFKLLTWYFSEDPRFEEAGFSLKKGICLAGKPGCGKTELLRIFQKNKSQCFHLENINILNNMCETNGLEQFKMYCGSVPGWGGLPGFFYQDQVGWAFDDVGLEDMVNDFGNKAFIFSKIIQDRYANKDKVPFRWLHLTTMLTPDQLEEKYGSFIRSRFREMFNYIHYPGEDRRK